MNTIKGCLFDLDGVIVDTAKYHFKAWRRLANELGFDFTEKDNERLKGISRMGSLNLILEMGGKSLTEAEKLEWATRKNGWYLVHVNKMTEAEILPGVKDFLEELQASSIRIGLGSSSKNAVRILTKIGLLDYFETIIDGTKTTKGKPNPQVFQMGAADLGTLPEETIVFEDAIAGVEAANRGGFYSIGVGEADVLGHAKMVISTFENFNLSKIKKA